MSKVAKFIASALNNSSANEAAQALKMAAHQMQKEQLNPADFLQAKGAGADTSKLESKIEEMQEEIDHWHGMWKESQADLKAAQAAKGSVDRSELTEARSLAVKYARELEAAQKALRASEMQLNAHKGTIQAREKELKEWKLESTRLHNVISRLNTEHAYEIKKYNWMLVAAALVIGAVIRMVTW